MSPIKAIMIHWSRSHRTVMCSSAAKGSAGEGTSCWSNLPLELLREVLARIEESESSWPVRKNVVACAGVCRGWRRIIIRELVKVPEVSGKLTFPISVKQPGPRDFLLHCFVRRCRSTQRYYLYLNLSYELAENGKFLLAAQKCRRATCTDYIICLDADNLSKGSSNYIGKLRSNFLGTKFTVIDRQPLHAGAKMSKSRSMRVVNLKQVLPRVPIVNRPVARLSYELNIWGVRGPRKMSCTMDGIPASAIEPGGKAPTQTEFTPHDVDFFPTVPFFQSKSKHHTDNFQSGPLISHKDGDGALVLKNKEPRWQENLQCWCLNFHGRVTYASVKNFQLVASPGNRPAGPEHDKIVLQFGKVGQDLFTLDYRYPLSAFQAFAICLGGFHTKIGCE